MIFDLLFNACLVEFIGNIATNARLYRRWCHAIRSMRERTGMQDLHADFNIRICLVDSVGHQPVLLGFPLTGHHGTAV